MTKQSAEQIEVTAEVMREYIKLKKWLAIRKKAGRKIAPETAEVMWVYGCDFDPYGLDPGLREELQQVSRQYFARAPGSDIWVEFGDLPAATRDALWEKHKASLAFPAGLPPIKDDPADDSPVVFKDGKTIVLRISESVNRQFVKAAAQMAKLREQICKGL